MRIVIVGLGKIGRTLSIKLDQEGHSIYVLDKESTVLEAFVNKYDNIGGFVGEASDVKALMECEVDKADVVIAATDADEMNILCCLMAKQLGAKRTVARVRKPEYVLNTDFFIRNLHIDRIINPERALALEISRILRFRSVLSAESFAGGKLEIVRFKLPQDCVLDGMLLSEVRSKYKAHILVCAVIRDDVISIPGGEYRLKGGDIVYLTAYPGEFTIFFKSIDKNRDILRSVAIIGGGKISRYLAQVLSLTGRDITIIEKDEKHAEELTNYFIKEEQNVEVYTADGADPDQMEEVNLQAYDAMVALTDIDEVNYMLSMYAQSINMKKIIAKINNNTYARLLSEQEIGTVVSTKDVVSDQIVAYVRALKNSESSSKIEAIYSLVEDRLDAMEFVIEKDSEYVGKPLRDLKHKGKFLVIGILHDGKVKIPNGNDFFNVGDHVIIVTTNVDVESIDDIFVLE